MAVLTGAQKWLRDPASLKARVLRCVPRRRRLARVARATGFEHRRPAVVHADDHRRRSAFLRETPDDRGGAAEAEAKAANLGCADGAQQSSRRERLHCAFRKRTLPINRCRVRPDDVGTNLFEC